MSIADRIAAYSRRPTATVRLDGRRWGGWQTLSCRQAYGGGISSGQVTGRAPPVTPVEGSTTITWSWGYDGYEIAGFSGIVTRITDQSYPDRWVLECQDWLWKASYRQMVFVADPINACPASTAITQFLTAAGIARMAIPPLAASGAAWAGSEWTLGVLTPVVFPTGANPDDANASGTTALAACQEICSVLGYWLYCDASGVVRAALMERKPSASPFRTLREGADFLVSGPPQRERDAASVYNRVVVLGATTGVDGAQIKDAWQTGAADRQREFSSALIEYENESDAGVASATGVAKRLLTLWGRQPNVIHVSKVKADPRIHVGTTLGVVAPSIGYGSRKTFFVYEVDTTLDAQAGRFDMAITLDGGTGDEGYTTIPPPVAAFSWTILTETIDGTAVVEVFLDGTGSYSQSEGEIVTYAWSTTTGTALSWPSSASGSTAVFVYPAATATADVTLIVTDTTSKTGSLTQTIALTGDSLAVPTARVVSVAAGAAWVASPDGGATWRTESSDTAIMVPEFGPGSLSGQQSDTSGMVAASSSALRLSTDILINAPTAGYAPGSTLTAIHQNTAKPARVFVAKGATIHRSTDGGATGAVFGTPWAGHDVTWIIEDPALDNSVFACVGNEVRNTTVAGVTGWATLFAGPTGATARQMVRSQDGRTTWVCFTGTFSGSPLQRIEGPVGVTFPVVTPAVSEIRAIAMPPGGTKLYAVDQVARLWHMDGQTGLGVTQSSQSFPAGTIVQHALHDPEVPLVYLADFDSVVSGSGAVRKYFPTSDALTLFKGLAAGQQAHRVGLGGRGIVTAGDVITGTWGTSVDGGGIYQHTSTGWVLKNSGLPANWLWIWVTASPFNRNQWLALGNAPGGEHATNFSTSGGNIVAVGTSTSPLWYTADAGATWQAVTLPHPAVASSDGSGGASYAKTARVTWGETFGGNWYITFSSDDIDPWSRRTAYYKGSGNAVTTGPVVAPLYGGYGWQTHLACAGQDNDLVIFNNFDGRIQIYAPDGGGSFTVVGGGALGVPTAFDRAATGTAVLEATNLGVYYTSNYRSVLVTSTGLTGISSVTGGQDAWYGGSSGGISRITPLTSPTTATVIPGTESQAITMTRADRQTRGIIAGQGSSGVVLVVTATQAATVIPWPVGAVISATAIEALGEA